MIFWCSEIHSVWHVFRFFICRPKACHRLPAEFRKMLYFCRWKAMFWLISAGVKDSWKNVQQKWLTLECLLFFRLPFFFLFFVCTISTFTPWWWGEAAYCCFLSLKLSSHRTHSFMYLSKVRSNRQLFELAWPDINVQSSTKLVNSIMWLTWPTTVITTMGCKAQWSLRLSLGWAHQNDIFSITLC